MSSLLTILAEAGIPLVNNRMHCPVCSAQNSGKGRSAKVYEHSFKCYKCDAYMNQAQTIKLMFPEGIALTEPQFNASGGDYFKRIRASEQCFSLYAKQQSQAIDYLVSRGYPTEKVLTWPIGFAETNTDLRVAGIDSKVIELAGLTNNYGNELYAERIVFPVLDKHGRLTHMQARSIDSFSEYKWLACKVPDNLKNTVLPLSSILYNSNLLYKIEEGLERKTIFLCEGLSDAHALKALDLPVLATFGIQNLNLAKNASLFKNTTIIACYDNDQYPKGHSQENKYKSWHHVLPQLANLKGILGESCDIHVLGLPNRSGIKDIFDLCKALEWNRLDFLDYAKNSLDTLADKALSVYGKQSLIELIDILKQIPCSERNKQELEKRVEFVGGWLSALR